MLSTDKLPERFLSAYKSLVFADLQLEILANSSKKPLLSELAYLISTASRLALCSDTDSEEAGAQCQLAYDIVVRAAKFANGSGAFVGPICEAILARVGNFPARDLMRQRNESTSRFNDPFLDLESVVREQENKIEDAPADITLTDFQVRLLESLRTASSVSVSAPTSAGKSFTLELELLYRLRP